MSGRSPATCTRRGWPPVTSLRVEQFPRGFSNLTYLVTASEGQLDPAPAACGGGEGGRARRGTRGAPARGVRLGVSRAYRASSPSATMRRSSARPSTSWSARPESSCAIGFPPDCRSTRRRCGASPRGWSTRWPRFTPWTIAPLGSRSWGIPRATCADRSRGGRDAIRLRAPGSNPTSRRLPRGWRRPSRRAIVRRCCITTSSTTISCSILPTPRVSSRCWIGRWPR